VRRDGKEGKHTETTGSDVGGTARRKNALERGKRRRL
jgi:hypothetical protein